MYITIYQREKDRKKVEKIIGHSLKTTEQVHHHTENELVVCENQAYHMLLHRRAKALEACSHADWRRCRVCKKYDSPENLWIDKYDRHWEHPESWDATNKMRRATTKVFLDLIDDLKEMAKGVE